MSLPVFVAPSLVGAAVGDEVEIVGDEARHAVVVRRIRVGEQVDLTDGRGTTATCGVTATSKESLTASVQAVSTSQPNQPRVVVVQAIPKGDRGELAVELLTEVGVDVVVPWAAARCVAVWRGARADKSAARWRTSAREAAKQARRTWFPVVEDQASTEQVLERVRRADASVVLHEGAATPLVTRAVPDHGEVVVVVGPEGGITDDELAAFAEAGAEPVRLGRTVLRTSTAGVAAVSALLSRTPRWR